MATNDELIKLVSKKPFEVLQLPDPHARSSKYLESDPFPHIIIDDFFNTDIARHIVQELKGFETEFSTKFEDDFQKNKSISTGDAVPTYFSILASKLAAPDFLLYLEELTGLKGLIPDPYYNTEYGYFHVVGPGGVLGSHLDHSHHDRLRVPHVLNLVVYLSDEWDESDGGSLCLFDRTGKKIVRKVPCKFNRAAIFAANPVSYHGVEPVKNHGKKRFSIYFAYYTVSSASNAGLEVLPKMHDGTNLSNENVVYGTYFVVPWSKMLLKRNRAHLKPRLTAFLKMFIPPFFIAVFRKCMHLARTTP